MTHVYVTEAIIHIAADSPQAADEILQNCVVFDNGPVRITDEHGHTLDLVYINAPQDEITENDNAYDWPFDGELDGTVFHRG